MLTLNEDTQCETNVAQQGVFANINEWPMQMSNNYIARPE